MLRGRKYYDEKGVQLAVYFAEVMNQTQGVNGGFSHKGTLNIDEAGKDTGIDSMFAPYDGNYGWKQSGDAPTGVVFDSKEKVHTAKLGIKYVTAFFWHDNNITDVSVGKFIAQGDHFYDEGTAGHATGNHVHFGVTVSDTPYDGSYPLIQNSYGNWEIKNEVNPWDVFFVNDTVIKNGLGYNWVKYPNALDHKPTVAVTPAAKLTVDGIWDKNTQKAIQIAMGTTADGIISNQIQTLTNRYIFAAQWGKGGSNWVKKLQAQLGVTVDGYIGGETIKALQKAMGVAQTGIILAKNDPCVMEMQKRLNAGTFKL